MGKPLIDKVYEALVEACKPDSEAKIQLDNVQPGRWPGLFSPPLSSA